MNSEKVSDHDRSTLWSFVSNGDHQQYAPHSCEISILEQANLTVQGNPAVEVRSFMC